MLHLWKTVFTWRIRKFKNNFCEDCLKKKFGNIIDMNLFLDKKNQNSITNLNDEFNEIGVKNDLVWLLKIREN